MKKTMLSTKQSYLVCFIGILAAFGIVMALCESGLADSYIKGIMMTACIAIIMTTSLNLTIGVLGQLTLGCCGFEANTWSPPALPSTPPPASCSPR